MNNDQRTFQPSNIEQSVRVAIEFNGPLLYRSFDKLKNENRSEFCDRVISSILAIFPDNHLKSVDFIWEDNSSTSTKF